MVQIIHLGDQSLPVQAELDSLSSHMLRMVNKDTVKVLGRLLRSHCECSTPNIPFERSTIYVLKSDFILGGFLPELRDVDYSENIIICPRAGRVRKSSQLIFADYKLGTQRKEKKSIVLVRGNGEDYPQIWVGKELLLFRCNVYGTDRSEEFAFIQYFERCPP